MSEQDAKRSTKSPNAFEVRAAILRMKWSPLAKNLAVLMYDLQGLSHSACTMSPAVLGAHLGGAHEQSVKRALFEIDQDGALEKIERGAGKTTWRRLLVDVVLAKAPPIAKPKRAPKWKPKPEGEGVTEPLPPDDPKGGNETATPGGNETATPRADGGNEIATGIREDLEEDLREEEVERSRAPAREPTTPPPAPTKGPGLAKAEPSTDSEPPTARMERARKLLERGYAERYKRATAMPGHEKGEPWMSAGANQGSIRVVAAFCVESGGELERVVDAVLDGFFARRDLHRSRWPWEFLAENPGRYAAAGRGESTAAPAFAPPPRIEQSSGPRTVEDFKRRRRTHA